MMLIIGAILYLLVGICGCGVHYSYQEREQLEHNAVSYLLMILFWPLLVAFAFGQSLMESK